MIMILCILTSFIRSQDNVTSQEDIDKEIKKLLEDLKSNTIQSRINASKDLRKLANPEKKQKLQASNIENIMQGLVYALKDTDGNVKNYTIVTLGKFGKLATPAIPKLIEELPDNNLNTQNMIIVSLDEIDSDWRNLKESQSAINQIKTKLGNQLNANNITFQNSAIHALGKLGPVAKSEIDVLVTKLIACSDDMYPTVEDTLTKIDPNWRTSAIEKRVKTISKFLKHSALHIFFYYTKKDIFIFYKTIRELNRIDIAWLKSDSAQIELIAPFHSPNWRIRQNTVRLFSNLESNPISIKHLQQSANDMNADVRQEVANALKKYPTPVDSNFTLKEIIQIALINLNILVILFLFYRSFSFLLESGRIYRRFNFPQPILFCLLYYQLFCFNSHYYCYDTPPGLWDWIEFTGAHILRASDILDIFEEYNIRLQNIQHNHLIPLFTIMAMHWIVDIFLITLFVQWVYRLGKKYLGAKFFTHFVRPVFILLLILIIIVVFFKAIKESWRWLDILLWPIDNIIRVIDVGDTFQLFQYHLHHAPPSPQNSAIALCFRVLMAIYFNRAIQRLWIRMTGIGTIELLIKSLSDKSPEIRVAAAESLGNFGTFAWLAVPELVKVLPDTSNEARQASHQSLVQVCTNAVHLVAPYLEHPNEIIRQETADILGEIGQSAKKTVYLLIKALVDKDDNVRVSVSRALDKIAPDWPKLLVTQNTNSSWNASHLFDIKFTIVFLIHSLGNSQQSVQNAAEEALCKIGEGAIQNLIKALVDEDWHIREKVAKILSRIAPDWPRSEIAVSLIPYFSKKLKSRQLPIFLATTDVLGKIGPSAQSVIPILNECLDTTNWEICWAIATLLGKIGRNTPSAISTLMILLSETNEDVSQTAKESLDKIDPNWPQSQIVKSAIIDLKNHLANSEPTIRENSARALGNLGHLGHWYENICLLPEAAITKLIQCLDDDIALVRKASAKALGKIYFAPNDPLLDNVIKALYRTLEDNYCTVRKTGANALGNLYIPSEATQNKLVKLLTDQDDNVRLAAKKALQKLCNP